MKDGSSDFALLMPLDGAVTRAQLGHELEVGAGDAVGILHHEPATMRFRRLEHLVVMVQRTAISPLVGDLERASTRLVPRGSEAVGLLTAYVRTIFANGGPPDPAVGRLAAQHICDLVALAIGPTREGREVALGRGVRAARLNAIKADLARDPALTLTLIAARQRVTPRYVQMLFEEEGTTFSAYALKRRLERTLELLTDQNYARWTISAIAFEAGFGDLSHFNRSFRRRYGASPSEVRAEARQARR